MRKLNWRGPRALLGTALVALLAAGMLLSCSNPTAAAAAAGQNGGAVDVRTGARMDKVVKPFIKDAQRRFRVGILQSGEFYFYNDVLKSIYNGLADLGWVAERRLDANQSALLSDVVAAYADCGDFLEFPPELYVNLNYEESAEMPALARNLLDGTSGADIVISLGTLGGTWVAKAASEGTLKVPVLVESVSDPIGSNILKTWNESGHPLFNVACDPGSYERQIRLFHQVVGFKRLGLIYSDSETGRSYVAYDDVRKLSKELGFDIVPYTDVIEDPQEDADIQEAARKFLRGVELLAPKVDAFYMGIQGGWTIDSLPAVLEVIKRHRVPVFAMEGVDFVKRGALMGESSNLLDVEGRFSAQKLTLILSGEPAGSLPQVSQHVPLISLNLKAARDIGYNFPVDLILGSDEVYKTIQKDTPEGAQP
jgi:ABC-type uncharacterized transport system substrate-binding protein